MIPVLFALALVFQGKFFKPIRAQKEIQAAAEAEFKEEKEREELEHGRTFQEQTDRERAVWEKRYREPEKKKPDVEQRQVDPPSPSKTDRKLHSATSFILDKLKPDTRAAATTERRQHHDEIRPVEVSGGFAEIAIDNTQTQRPKSPRRYPSLRPTSYPPRPCVPQTDDECDTPSDGRVSSLGLAVAMDDHARHVIPDQAPAEVESSTQSSEQREYEENTSEAIKLSRQDPANSEQHITQQPLDEDETAEQHLPLSDQEDLNEPLQYAHLRPESLVLGQVPNDHVHQHSTRKPELTTTKWEQQEETRNRMDEWRNTLTQIELNSRPPSIHPYDENDEPSVWAGFEGTHATDVTSERFEGHETAAPQPLQHDLSRAGALKQNKRKSRRLSDTEGKTAIIPTPVKSARVKKRNSALPMLDTRSTLLDNRTAIAEQRKKQISVTSNFLNDESQGAVARRNFGSHGKFMDGGLPNHAESTDLDEITLSQARAVLHARSVSTSQVSTNSSHPPRASSSVDCQSPVITTARTTPTVSSPVHNYPPFAMVAHPLRSPYPMPPCEPFEATASPYRHSGGVFGQNGIFTPSGANNPATVIQNDNSWTPRTPRRSSAPAPFPAAQPTLIHRMEFDENLKRQNEENLRKAQRRGTAEAAENKKRLDAQRRVALRAENSMRRGHLDNAHQEAMRKMQREVNKNCQ